MTKRRKKKELDSEPDVKKRTSFKQVLGMMRLCNAEGHDIRIPLPDDRPLIVLIYREYEQAKVLRFKTLREAYELLEDMWRESQSGD